MTRARGASGVRPRVSARPHGALIRRLQAGAVDPLLEVLDDLLKAGTIRLGFLVRLRPFDFLRHGASPSG